MIPTTIALIAQATPVASPSPTAAASPAAAATPDIAKVTDTAKAWFISLQHGKVLDPKQLTDEMMQALTPAMLTQVGSTSLPWGNPTAFSLKKNGEKMGNTFYLFDVTCSTGTHANYIIIFDDATGKISGLRMLPAQ